MDINRHNRNDFWTQVTAGTTEKHLTLTNEITEWVIGSATACRVSMNHPLVISTAPTVYRYSATGATFTAQTLPITVSSMATADRLYICVPGKEIKALEFTLTQANSTAATAALTYFTNDCEINPMNITNYSATGTVFSDGTISSSCSLGQSGRMVFEDIPEKHCNTLGGVGAQWYGLSFSSALDSNTVISAITALGPHRTIDASGTGSGKSAVKYIYYRTDGGTGTLTIQGQA